MGEKNSGDITIDGTRYASFFDEVKTCIKSAQYEALRAVNKELVKLYWDLGRLTVERQSKEGWGTAVIEKLAAVYVLNSPENRGFLLVTCGIYEAYTCLIGIL